MEEELKMNKIQNLEIKFKPTPIPIDEVMEFRCEVFVRYDDGQIKNYGFSHLLDFDNFKSVWEDLMERATKEIKYLIYEEKIRCITKQCS